MFVERTYKTEFQGSRELKVVDKELDHLVTTLNALLESAGLLPDGTFSNITTNNLTVNNNIINNGGQTGTASGILLRATRTFTQAQIQALNGTPLELLTPTGLGTAPGAGFACNPVRCDWTLNTVAAAFNNVSSDARIAITLGSETAQFGPHSVASQLIPDLAIQAATTGLFDPTGTVGSRQSSPTFENQAIFAVLYNDLGALTGGSAATLVVNVYYVITPVSQATATNTIVYTTTARKVEPPAANGIAVTPSGTAFTDSAWFEIDASTSAAWALAAIAFNPGLNQPFTFVFEVGVGAAGSEVTVATISGRLLAEATCQNHRLAWMVPIGGRIAASSRVAVRMRKTGTDTTNWTVALEYFEEPMAGNAVVSPVVPNVYPDLTTSQGTSNITPSATSGSYSAWSIQANASPLATDIVISGAVAVTASNTGDMHYELSVGDGADGQQTIYKIRGNAKDVSTLGQGGPYHQICYPALPIIRAGNSIGGRLRKVNTDVTTWGVPPVTAYPGAAFPLLTTEQANKWYPDTGNSLVALTQSGVAWANAAYAVLFTTTTDITVTAVLVNIDTTTTGIEIDVATGSPGAEVVKATVRLEAQSVFSGDVQPIPLVLGRNIASGSIISLRCRTSSTVVGVAAGIGYIENPDFYQRLDTVSVCYPAAANAISVAGNTTAWANSSYGELVSATASAVYLTHLNFLTSLTSIEAEFDLATGAASSEVVIGTFRTYVGNTSSGGQGQIPIVPPIRVAASTRIAVRLRKTGTSATGFTFSAQATPTA